MKWSKESWCCFPSRDITRTQKQLDCMTSTTMNHTFVMSLLRSRSFNLTLFTFLSFVCTFLLPLYCELDSSLPALFSIRLLTDLRFNIQEEPIRTIKTTSNLPMLSTQLILSVARLRQRPRLVSVLLRSVAKSVRRKLIT